MTIAVAVRRASAEHISPIVDVAMQVVAMMSKIDDQRPEAIAQLGEQDVGEQKLLGEQEGQHRRDPQRGQQLGEHDLAGPEQGRQQQAQGLPLALLGDAAGREHRARPAG